MVTRLSASDAAFFGLENSSTPMYVGSLSIVRKPRGGLGYETLLATVEQRLPQIPRYRQKVRAVLRNGCHTYSSGQGRIRQLLEGTGILMIPRGARPTARQIGRPSANPLPNTRDAHMRAVPLRWR